LNSTVKTALLWVVIIVLVFLLWSLFQTTKGTSDQIPFSTFIDRVNKGQVEKVTIRGDEIRGTMKGNVPANNREFHLNGPANYPQMIDLLNTKQVQVDFEPKGDTPFITALITWAPVLS
jgi:cell division protease FtsH